MKKKSSFKRANALKKNSTVAASKRRGRRPKKIIENLDVDIEDTTTYAESPKNSSAVITKLKINPSKLETLLKKAKITVPKKEEVSNQSDDKDDDTSDGMFKNDIPNDSVCHKCAKNEKTIAMLKAKLDKYEKKEKLDKATKIYSNKLNFISVTNKKKITLKKTNIKCWWDGHSFSTLPCVLPELLHNNIYHVLGCFCSFNCALAYNLYYLKDSKVHYRKSLVYKLYREMYDLSIDEEIEIKEAPPKEVLEDYGGDMSIEVFRRSFVHHKEYLVYTPPMKPINLIIEERNTQTVDNADKEYVLRRTKPLAKKRSVISSMKINMDD